MRRLICTVAAVAIGVSGVGCSSSETPGEVSRSGVGIVVSGCGLTASSGSGVVLGETGQIVTVAHTLRGATDVVVVDAAGAEHPAVVTAFDKDADLAVLRAPTLGAPPLQLGPVAPGEGSAMVWSREDGISSFPVEISKRLAVTIEDIYGDGRVRRSAIEVVADIEVGDSGGPILDASGMVVGVIYANSRQREGVGFAVDAGEIGRIVGNDVDDGMVDTGPCP